MLIKGEIYSVAEILKDAGLSYEYIEGKEVTIGGIRAFSIDQRIRVQTEADLVIVAGRQENKSEVAVNEEEKIVKEEEKKVEKKEDNSRSEKRRLEVQKKVAKDKANKPK